MEAVELGGGLRLLRPARMQDPRGWLSELYGEAAFAAAGVPTRFVQDNLSWTPEAGVVRGLHAQRPPHAQAKLFRVARGRVFTVAVDLRPARFGAVDARILDEGRWIFLPEGFAHGFQTLHEDTEIHYKVSRPFAPEALVTLDWREPELGLAWPIPPRTDLRSARDLQAEPLRALRALYPPS